MQTKPKTTDQYLAALAPDRRLALERLRQTIRKVVPKVEECISYSMPAFRFEGHVVAGFLATKRGCSYFPFSGTTLATLADSLSDYEQTKSALHFDVDKPLPIALVRKLLDARIAETKAKAPGKAKAKTPGKAKARTPGKAKAETPGKAKAKTPGKAKAETPGKAKAKTPGKAKAKTPVRTVKRLRRS